VDSFDILKRLSGNRENKKVPVAISDDKWKDVVKWLHKGSKKLKKKTPKSYEEFERPYVTALIWHTSSRRASNNISSILDESTKDYQKKIANAVWKTRKHLSKLKQLCTDPDRAPPESKHEGGNLTFEALLSRHIERAKFLCELSNISFSSSNVSIVESDPVPLLSRFTTASSTLSSSWKALRGAIRFSRLLKSKKRKRGGKEREDTIKDVDAYVQKGFLAPPSLVRNILETTRPSRAVSRTFGMRFLLSLLQNTKDTTILLPLLIWRLRDSLFCNVSKEYHPLSNLKGCDTSEVYQSFVSLYVMHFIVSLNIFEYLQGRSPKI